MFNFALVGLPSSKYASGRRRDGSMRSTMPLIAILIAALVSACALNSGPQNPDPGNKHLNELVADPIFGALPPGAVAAGSLALSPARRRAVFGGSVWDGPGVSLTFTSTQSPASVFGYYAKLTIALGWVPNGNKNVLGYPEVWNKPYPGGVRGGLSLIDTSIRSVSPGVASTYILNGSA